VTTNHGARTEKLKAETGEAGELKSGKQKVEIEEEPKTESGNDSGNQGSREQKLIPDFNSQLSTLSGAQFLLSAFSFQIFA
jgi:hypothetical protein